MIENLSQNFKFQATYTTKLELCTLYDVKELKIKCNNALKITNFIYFNYFKLYIIFLFVIVRIIRWTITSLATVYVYFT